MLMSLIISKVQAWITYRDTVRELQCLNDKELSDLGIARSDIKDVAHRAAHSQHDTSGWSPFLPWPRGG
jgi:uncharacterized protein YjiS (DUF1127 family)